MGVKKFGNQLKKYEEPLTKDILQRLHSTHTLKEGQALLRKQAQEEAKHKFLQSNKNKLLTFSRFKSMRKMKILYHLSN